jgi:hypothetical protein
LTLALPLGALAAQGTPTLARGTRVRVAVEYDWVVGTLESIDSASIVLRRANGEVANLPRGEYTQVDGSAGPGICSPGNRGACVVAGFLGGAALGFGVAALTSRGGESPGVSILAVPAGVLVGTIVGAVVGGEHWHRVELPARLSLALGAPGAVQPWQAVRVGVRLAF